jgi:hypothetical protein
VEGDHKIFPVYIRRGFGDAATFFTVQFIRPNTGVSKVVRTPPDFDSSPAFFRPRVVI